MTRVAVIVFCSAKGAPGVTTTAMLVTALWPRPVVLVDADTAGGDVALRVPDPGGRPLNPERGLLTLLPVARRGIAPHALREHAQELSGGTQVIAGLAGSEQARAVGALWPVLGETFARAEYDVIVDAGRTGPDSVHLPVLAHADLVVTVVRPGVTAVIHAREQARSLARVLPAAPRGPAHGLLVVHPVTRGTAVDETRSAIRSLSPSTLDVGHLALDPQAAVMFEGQPVSRPERTMLVRSGRQVVATLLAVLADLSLVAGPSAVVPQAEPAASPDPNPATGPAEDADRAVEVDPPVHRQVPTDAPTPPAGIRRPGQHAAERAS